MRWIHLLLGEPQFDHYRREYVYLSGERISEFEYNRRFWEMYEKIRERNRKIEMEEKLKAIQATEVMKVHGFIVC